MWHECAERIQTAWEGYSLVFCWIRWHHRGVLMNDERRVCFCEVTHRGEWSPPPSLVSIVVHFQLLCKNFLWNKMKLFFAVVWLFWCFLALLIDSSLALSFWSGKHAVSWFCGCCIVWRKDYTSFLLSFGWIKGPSFWLSQAVPRSPDNWDPSPQAGSVNEPTDVLMLTSSSHMNSAVWNRPQSAVGVQLLEVALSYSNWSVSVLVIFLLLFEVYLVLCCYYCFKFSETNKIYQSLQQSWFVFNMDI